jgi:prophage antirepressor-like protein
MSHQLISFENQEIGEIKGLIIDGEPWFLAGQVCRCLGIKNTSQAVEQIEQRMTISGVKGISSKYTLLDSEGGRQKNLIIPEPFLYELIFQSRKQKAVKFRTWVTTEVLPSLRKTGQYRMEGKLIRRSLTDEIQASGENERMHGHAYSTYTRLIYKTLGIDKKDRDTFDGATLEKVARRENTVKAMLSEGSTYHEIKEYLEKISEKKEPA